MKGRGKKSEKYGDGKPTDTNSDSSLELKLVLSDSIKQALITDHGFNALKIEKLLHPLEN